MTATVSRRAAALELTLFAALGAVACAAGAQQSDSVRHGTIDTIVVHGRSLEGNLEGDSPDRTVNIYLPPSYAEEPARRYPVVYLLHGYGRTALGWTRVVGLPGSMDRDIAAGKAREMVLVIPDANTRYGGSMYSSSPTTGDWETFVTEELVAYIDGHYRTLADRESRGLGGHSMGGYGVWRIAMKRPDVYSSIYAMSACCLMNNPRPRPPQAAQRRSRPGAPELEPGAHPVNVPYGEAAAWSPNPENPPLYFDEPVQNGSVRFEIAAKWIANSPLAMLDQYLTNMAKYDAIGMEVGLKDTLLGSNQEMDRALTRQGVEHTFQTFDGAHSDRLAERIEQAVLPFFSEHLKFDASKDAGR